MTNSVRTYRPEYDEQSLAVIADMLGTLYTNPHRSVLREYIANGMDAHREAGVDKPLHVILPSDNTPVLQIQDFGNGMSKEDIIRVFFSYGRSTKWDSDNAIGMFGIGAKSAYSISPTWEVISVHDGIKYTALAHNEDGDPQFDMDDGVSTDDPSGVTISIPVDLCAAASLIDTLKKNASDIISWFPEGSISLFQFLRDGGKSPMSVKDGKKYIRLGNVYVNSKNYYPTSPCAVLNNITYPYLSAGYHSELSSAVSKKYPELDYMGTTAANHLCTYPIHVDPSGEGISIPPNREQVKETSLTLSTLSDAVAETAINIQNRLLSIKSLPYTERVAYLLSVADTVTENASGDACDEDRLIGSFLAMSHSFDKNKFMEYLDIRDDVVAYRTSWGGTPYVLSSFMKKSSFRTMLVTSVPKGTKLPSIRRATREYQVYTTVNETSEIRDESDPSRNYDIAECFTSIVSFAEYKKKYAPSHRTENPVAVWFSVDEKTSYPSASSLRLVVSDFKRDNRSALFIVTDSDTGTAHSKDSSFSNVTRFVVKLKDELPPTMVINRGRRSVKTLVEALRKGGAENVLLPETVSAMLHSRATQSINKARSVLDTESILAYAVQEAVSKSGMTSAGKLMLFVDNNKNKFTGHWILDISELMDKCVSAETKSFIDVMFATSPTQFEEFKKVVKFDLIDSLPLLKSVYYYEGTTIMEEHVIKYMTMCADVDPLIELRSRIEAWKSAD